MVPRMLESSGNVQSTEVCIVLQRVGNRVTEFGFKYFCLDYVSKIGVSVMERNIPPGPISIQCNPVLVFTLHPALSAL